MLSLRIGEPGLSRVDKVTAGTTPVTFVTTNGTQKHSNIVLSNGNLTEHGLGGDANYQVVAANAAKTGKRYFEVSIDTLVAGQGRAIGIYDGATPTLATDVTSPLGPTFTSGCVVNITGSQGFLVYKNGTGTDGGALTYVATDWVGVEYDTVAGTVSFFLIHSGSATQISTTQTTVGQSGWANVFAFVGGFDSAQSTANFAGPFIRTLTSGYSAYGS